MDRYYENDTIKQPELPIADGDSKDIRTFIELKLQSEETRQLILRKARRLVEKAGRPIGCVEDVSGSLVESLVRDSKVYDPQLGDWLPFAERSLQFASKNLLRHWFAGKRHHGKTLSLHVTVQFDDVGPTELAQLMTNRELGARTGAATLGDVELFDLRLDVSEFKASLPPRLRELAEALERETILEISRRTSVPRSTLYDRLELLRRAAEDRGLAKYFEE